MRSPIFFPTPIKHVVTEGAFDLPPYSAIRDRIGRVAAQLEHISINDDCSFLIPAFR